VLAEEIHDAPTVVALLNMFHRQVGPIRNGANANFPGSGSESFDIRGTPGAVTPEPGSYAALILGFGGVMLVVRSRRAKQGE
jgi:hypothetical protein